MQDKKKMIVKPHDELLQLIKRNIENSGFTLGEQLDPVNVDFGEYQEAGGSTYLTFYENYDKQDAVLVVKQDFTHIYRLEIVKIDLDALEYPAVMGEANGHAQIYLTDRKLGFLMLPADSSGRIYEIQSMNFEEINEMVDRLNLLEDGADRWIVMEDCADSVRGELFNIIENGYKKNPHT